LANYNVDVLGHLITIGQYIVYPTTVGSKSVLKIYEVLDIRQAYSRLDEEYANNNYYTLFVEEAILFDSVRSGRVLKIKYPEKCLIVPKEYLKRDIE
jgi:predicted RNase H-related nuclease YkuK (DUF458 family)